MQLPPDATQIAILAGVALSGVALGAIVTAFKASKVVRECEFLTKLVREKRDALITSRNRLLNALTLPENGLGYTDDMVLDEACNKLMGWKTHLSDVRAVVDGRKRSFVFHGRTWVAQPPKATSGRFVKKA